MISFNSWLLERFAMQGIISDNLAAQLKDLLKNPQEAAGYITNDMVRVLNNGGKGGVFLGHASAIRAIDCNYTFHTHPRDTDVAYPSGMDVVAAYMTNKPDLVVCQTGIWMVTPLQTLDWRDVERISNQFKKESRNYWEWKNRIENFFKVNIKKVYNFDSQVS